VKTVQLILFLFFGSVCIAQIQIEYLNDVPEEFKEKYYSQPRNYNPLQVGNMWQYYDGEFDNYYTTTVVKDSIINGQQYFKKIYYHNEPLNINYVSWERNDTTSGVSFLLDFEDVNENGDYLEELPLDSLENPWNSRYSTYKYSFESPNPFSFYPGKKTVLVDDSSWVRLAGDTLLSKRFQITELFWQETVIENFGIYDFMQESPVRYCTGAIINGRQYGIIVGVEEDNQELKNTFSLKNNYPNPFNPSTTINYSIFHNHLNSNQYHNVKLIVYDALGREVAVLINEQKSGGNYSIVFNAVGLSSGVYYYSLITDSKIITKPMILIK